jgi:hypothetical protein
MEGDARQIASTAEDSANSRSLFVLWRFSSEVVGATGFEPATPCAQGMLGHACEVAIREQFAGAIFLCGHFWGRVRGDVQLLSVTQGEVA